MMTMRNNTKFLALFTFFLGVFGILCAEETMGDLRAVLDAQKGNDCVIDIPKGTYVLDLKDGKGPYVFSYRKNVKIKGNGSTIICNFQNQAFSFDHCENMTFSDLIIDYDPPCSTQGTILSMSDDAKTLQVEIHEGYPMINPETEQDRVHIFDKDTRELVWDFYSNQITDPIKFLDGRKIEINLAMPKIGVYKVGDYIVFNNIPKGYKRHCMILNYCKNMTMSNVTMYDAPQFHFAEHYCENTHYYRCLIDRKKNDPRFPIDRLRPGIADGIHSKHATIGPTIEECTLLYLNDDPIAINGNFYPVSSVDADYKQLYVLTRDGSLGDFMLKQDENLVAVSNGGVRRGAAKASRVRFSTPPTSDEVKKCLSYFRDIKDTRYINKAMIQFSDEEWQKIGAVAPGDVLYSTDRLGAGFKVINNTIGHVPGRGILIKSSNGKIQNNTITNTGAGAIIIGPEFNWMEAGLSENLEISGNYIETCMWRQNLKRSQCAAISVVLEASNGDLGRAGGLRNIIIHRNTIKDCPMPCVFLNGIDGGYFYKNTIEPATWMRDHGQNFLIPNNRPYVTKYVSNIITDEDPLTSIDEVKSNSEQEILIDASGRVSLKDHQGEPVKMRIFDMVGKQISEDDFTEFSTVSLNDFGQGIYVIHLTCNNRSFSKKYSVF